MPSSILQDGKLKPGVYQIQNLTGQTFVEMQEGARQLCCRPATALSAGDGLWDFQPFGPGYTIRKFHTSNSSKPDLYCTMLEGLGNRSSIAVSPYPVTWRIRVVDEEQHKGFEYIRIFWSTTEMVWDLAWWGNSSDGNKVQLFANSDIQQCQNWKLIPVENATNAIACTKTRGEPGV